MISPPPYVYQYPFELFLRFKKEMHVCRKGMKKQRTILLVCTGNLDRSPTAEDLLKATEGLEVKSAGTSRCAPTLISKELIAWADRIFAMENHHKDAILSIAPTAEEKVVVLDIADRYRRGDPDLIKLLKVKLTPHLGRLWE